MIPTSRVVSLDAGRSWASTRRIIGRRRLGGSSLRVREGVVIVILYCNRWSAGSRRRRDGLCLASFDASNNIRDGRPRPARKLLARRLNDNLVRPDAAVDIGD